jgi:DNA polymerase V
MQCKVSQIFASDTSHKLSRPLILFRVPAGFPSPADNYIEGRIDLNHELIPHPLATFYIRVMGDSMQPLIYDGDLIIVDRMTEVEDTDIVVACIGTEVCVKRLEIGDDSKIYLLSENPLYKPIEITEGMRFEVWGKVLHTVHTFNRGKVNGKPHYNGYRAEQANGNGKLNGHGESNGHEKLNGDGKLNGYKPK